MKLFYSLIVTILSLSLQAGSNIAIIGGGGEDRSKSSTMFDQNLELLGQYYRSTNWQETTVSFNGGHSNTESILRSNFRISNQAFTNDNYDRLIESYKNKIKNKTLKSGDQLLIYIDTHGAVKIEGELTHQIATSGASVTDYNNLSGTSTVSMDKLKELTNLANQNGIKLAILDFSCHSGNSLPLANENTCVVTSTGPNHYAYGGAPGTFSYNFALNMKKGKNLEEVFIESRKTTTDMSFPMISTPQNQAIAEFEYNNISPFLYYYEKDTDKLTPYLMDAASHNLFCKREDAFNKLNRMIDHVEKINIINKKTLFSTREEKEVDLTSLKENLKKYKDLQDKMIATLKSLKAHLLSNEMEISSGNEKSRTRIVDKHSWGEIIATDYDAQISRVRARIQAKNDRDPNSYDNMLIRYYQDGKNKRDKILRDNPDLAKIPNVVKEFDKNFSDTSEIAQKISDGEKRLYHALYMGQKHLFQNQNNPCKNFVL